MSLNHLVVCYDVVANYDRRKLHRALKGYLRPVQKSVFEGSLPPRRVPALRRAVEGLIDLETDTARIYHLCRGCRAQTDLLGTSPMILPAPLCRVI